MLQKIKSQKMFEIDDTGADTKSQRREKSIKRGLQRSNSKHKFFEEAAKKAESTNMKSFLTQSIVWPRT